VSTGGGRAVSTRGLPQGTNKNVGGQEVGRSRKEIELAKLVAIDGGGMPGEECSLQGEVA